MPMYEYVCDSCDSMQEEYRSSHGDDSKESTCEICGGVAKRILSTFKAIVPVDAAGDRMVIKSLEKARDHRSMAAQESHMGAEPYTPASGLTHDTGDVR